MFKLLIVENIYLWTYFKDNTGIGIDKITKISTNKQNYDEARHT